MASERIHLSEIVRQEKKLAEVFHEKLEVNHDLDRTLVSFQANRAESGNRWYKYKEGFSAALMRYLFSDVRLAQSPVLDPFAGSGTALFSASDLGLASIGIELLPSSAEVIEVRSLLRRKNRAEIAGRLREFAASRIWEHRGKVVPFPHVKITQGAFSEGTEQKLGRYLFEIERVTDVDFSRILRFAAMCILESISFTRKDGQYLRWDYRSGRPSGDRKFDKGVIFGFSDAISAKLEQLATDLTPHDFIGELYQSHYAPLILHRGSCLDLLKTFDSNSVTGVVTSPPYCNRYDYTRTYALELAFLGIDEEGFRNLRQELLSCTVENREKKGLEARVGTGPFCLGNDAFQNQELLRTIIEYLNFCREQELLNNGGIARMVQQYFQEMAIVIADLARILKPGAPLYMVNDNVRYQGIQIPVDLILSDIASKVGFDVERIWVLPRGKGNSSQQMGTHGREELRKCVYVWRTIERPTRQQHHRSARSESNSQRSRDDRRLVPK